MRRGQHASWLHCNNRGFYLIVTFCLPPTYGQKARVALCVSLFVGAQKLFLQVPPEIGGMYWSKHLASQLVPCPALFFPKPCFMLKGQAAAHPYLFHCCTTAPPISTPSRVSTGKTMGRCTAYHTVKYFWLKSMSLFFANIRRMCHSVRSRLALARW